MDNYMKGYSNRNRRRRESYIRRASSRRRKHFPLNKAVFGIGAVLIIIVVFGVVRFFMPSGSGDSAAGTSGSSVAASGGASQAQAAATGNAAEATAIPGGVAEKVAAVSTLPSKAILSPTPKPRSKAIALTFDDGPSTENTPKVLETLKKYNAHATFFVVGNRVKAGADVLKQAVAQGNEIGNHSWDHANLSKKSMKFVNAQYDGTTKLVQKMSGFKISFMRPPYGAISDKMRKKLKHPMVLWSVDTLDWKTRDAKAVFKSVKRQVSDGDIILMHDIHSSTAEAIKKVIPWLIKQDYDLLTVSELMERKGLKMKNGKAYGSAR